MSSYPTFIERLEREVLERVKAGRRAQILETSDDIQVYYSHHDQANGAIDALLAAEERVADARRERDGGVSDLLAKLNRLEELAGVERTT